MRRHDDGEDILQDQYAHDRIGKALLCEPHIRKSLIDNGGGTHGEHAAQKDTVHLFPPEAVTDDNTQCHHTEENGTGRNDRGYSRLENLFHGEVPNENSRKMTPMSAHVCISALSTTLIR